MKAVLEGLFPFRGIREDGTSLHLSGDTAATMEEWSLVPDWRDDLSIREPRWCKVWFESGTASVERVCRYSKSVKGGAKVYPYKTITGGVWDYWEYAEPLDDELAALLNEVLEEGEWK